MQARGDRRLLAGGEAGVKPVVRAEKTSERDETVATCPTPTVGWWRPAPAGAFARSGDAPRWSSGPRSMRRRRRGAAARPAADECDAKESRRHRKPRWWVAARRVNAPGRAVEAVAARLQARAPDLYVPPSPDGGVVDGGWRNPAAVAEQLQRSSGRRRRSRQRRSPARRNERGRRPGRPRGGGSFRGVVVQGAGAAQARAGSRKWRCGAMERKPEGAVGPGRGEPSEDWPSPGAALELSPRRETRRTIGEGGPRPRPGSSC